MNKELFRKSALQKSDSPDQLEQLITLTKTHDWIILLIIFLSMIIAIIWSFLGNLSIEINGSGILVNEGGLLSIVSPAEGIISNMRKLEQNDIVQKGQVLATLQPFQLNHEQKAENFINIISPFSASIVELTARDGDYIVKGGEIVHLEDKKRKLQALIFLPMTTRIEQIKVGMSAQVTLGERSLENSSYLNGVVRSVSDFPASRARMLSLLHDEILVDSFMKKGPPFIVTVDLPKNQSNIGNKNNKSFSISSGLLCSASIITEKKSPIHFIFNQ